MCTGFLPGSDSVRPELPNFLPMPYNREALVYTNEYWETWIEREMPELLGLPTEESAE